MSKGYIGRFTRVTLNLDGFGNRSPVPKLFPAIVGTGQLTLHLYGVRHSYELFLLDRNGEVAGSHMWYDEELITVDEHQDLFDSVSLVERYASDVCCWVPGTDEYFEVVFGDSAAEVINYWKHRIDRLKDHIDGRASGVVDEDGNVTLTIPRP